jgi:hypothetical protein
MIELLREVGDTSAMEQEIVTYRDTAAALALHISAAVLGLLALAFAIAGVVGEDGFVGAALIGAGAVTIAWLGWPLSYRATLHGDRVSFRQLTGTRETSLSEIAKITTRWYGQGLGTMYVIHFTNGKAAVDGKRGKEFAETLLEAAPTITSPKR